MARWWDEQRLNLSKQNSSADRALGTVIPILMALPFSPSKTIPRIMLQYLFVNLLQHSTKNSVKFDNYTGTFNTL